MSQYYLIFSSFSRHLFPFFLIGLLVQILLFLCFCHFCWMKLLFIAHLLILFMHCCSFLSMVWIFLDWIYSKIFHVQRSIYTLRDFLCNFIYFNISCFFGLDRIGLTWAQKVLFQIKLWMNSGNLSFNPIFSGSFISLFHVKKYDRHVLFSCKCFPYKDFQLNLVVQCTPTFLKSTL